MAWTRIVKAGSTAHVAARVGLVAIGAADFETDNRCGYEGQSEGRWTDPQERVGLAPCPANGVTTTTTC